MKLTKTTIDQMTYQGRSSGRDAKDVRWDDEVPGFGIRIWPSGKKTFFVIYRHHGRERFMTLGPFGILTVQQARDMARQTKVANLQGRDPLADRQKQADGATFGDFAKAYWERYGSKKRSAKDDESILRLHLLPAWEKLPLRSIRRADVAQLHHRISEKKAEPAPAERKGRDWKKGLSTGGPYQANRAVALLSVMFNLARKWGFLPDNWANPAKDIDRNKEEERERFCTPEEVRRLVAQIDKQANVFVRLAIWGYLLTGVRKGVLLKLKWSDVDYAARTVTVRVTKKGRPFVAPITTHLEEILRQVPKLSGNPYVFCGNRRGKHLVSINGNWDDIRTAAGLKEVRIHDLRHTVITWLANAGHSFALIGKAVDQTNERTTKRYAHLQLRPAAKLLEAHGRQLKAVLAAEDEKALQAIFDVDPHSAPPPNPFGDPEPGSAASGSL